MSKASIMCRSVNVDLLDKTNTLIPDPNMILKLLLFTQEINQLQKPAHSFNMKCPSLD